MKKIVLAIFIASFVYPGIIYSQIDYKGFPEWSLHTKDSTEYALYTPSHLEPGKKYPIALFMHGCCGVDNHASLRNAVDPPVRMWHQFGANKQTVPTYIIAPATARGWSQHFKDLKAVMDDLIAHHQGDPQRIYVCGFSMGGDGTFRIIQEYPGYFAAAIPMGMNFHGDFLKVKDIPMWVNQGETDPHATSLRTQVAAVRELNGLSYDTGATWITGVNPRYSNFTGVGHGVQWDAASTQDLTGWAYSKVNDGNKYPVIFFTDNHYPIKSSIGKRITIQLSASDPDGAINKILISVNHHPLTTLQHPPYQFSFTPSAGDNLIEATAIDNQGKKNIATSIVRIDTKPKIITRELPAAVAGDYYKTKISATGNGILYFSASTKLPEGLQLFPDGYLKGIPVQKGNIAFNIKVKDEKGDTVTMKYSLSIRNKKPGQVLILHAGTDSVSYPVGIIKTGEMPFFNNRDTTLPVYPDEINFSNVQGYEDLSFIRTNSNDADANSNNFLHVETDEDVMVYVCYEKISQPVPSTIPGWLQDFRKEAGQIVAQYRYFDVYSKSFKKGKFDLGGADAKHNGVSSNYFVLLKKK